ncbi:MAG: glycosyltransferase family 2 protein [Saprospiraceae bacterium]|jgi:dolichol-phosphate mannosyltransferase|nr:glycosyltransferase family 2 protein [Saprospiraceae bacterium]MBP6567481.1 glycosyltransferase family 2 protein [Saprospiraceae bacterium]
MKEAKISVIIPVFNEELNIGTLYARIKDVLAKIDVNHELIFVNDNSRDASLQIIKELAIKDPSVKYIDFSRNFGHQVAVSAGLEYCSGEYVVIIDADLQDPPELIIDMYEKINKGFDVVYAKRRSRKDRSVVKKAAYKLFYKILAVISQIEIPLDTGDFRMMKKNVVDELLKMQESNKFLRGQIAWLGFNQTYVEYDRDIRAAGEPGYTYYKLFRLALDGIISFSNMPLRVATIMGVFVFLLSLIIILYTLYSYFYHEYTPQGWASLMISVLFIGGIQLLTIGIIGEYIGRIQTEVRKRPLFVVKETNIQK